MEVAAQTPFRVRAMFEARLKEWDPDLVLTVAKQVRDLMAQPGWLKLQELVEQVAHRHERELFHGKTLPQADYARLIGVISGLTALPEASEVLFEFARKVADERERTPEARQAAGAERT